MYKYAAILLLSALSLNAYGETTLNLDEQNKIVLSHTVNLPNTTIIHLKSAELIHDYLLLDVTLNGKGPYSFILDTNASYNYIPLPLAKRLGFKEISTNEQPIRNYMGRLSTKTTLFQAQTVKIGDAEFKDLSFLSGNAYQGDDAIFNQYNIRGVIGISTFKKLLLTLNLWDKKIILTNGSLKDDAAAVDFKYHNLTPIVESVITTDKPYNFDLSLSTTSASLFQFEFCKDETPFLSSRQYNLELGVDLSRPYYREQILFDTTLDGNITFANQTAYKPTIRFTEEECFKEEQNGSIGSATLKKFKVVIDQQNQKIKFTQN